MMFYVFSDPLDRSGSKLRYASDGDGEGSPLRWYCVAHPMVMARALPYCDPEGVHAVVDQ
jgi:hypothetical protein